MLCKGSGNCKRKHEPWQEFSPTGWCAYKPPCVWVRRAYFTAPGSQPLFAWYLKQILLHPLNTPLPYNLSSGSDIRPLTFGFSTSHSRHRNLQEKVTCLQNPVTFTILSFPQLVYLLSNTKIKHCSIKMKKAVILIPHVNTKVSFQR